MNPMSSMTYHEHGFTWEQVEVKLLAEIERSNGVYRVIKVNNLDIYVSPAGKTRVIRNGRELKEPERHVEPGSRRTCEVCRKWILVRADGQLRIHGKRMDGSVCRGGAQVLAMDTKGAERRKQRNGVN